MLRIFISPYSSLSQHINFSFKRSFCVENLNLRVIRVKDYVALALPLTVQYEAQKCEEKISGVS
jgi:hypothetical protein